MRNILYIIIGTLLFFISCSEQETIAPSERYADVTLSLGAERKEVKTRATDMFSTYDIRYIIEVRRVDDNKLFYRGLQTAGDLSGVEMSFHLIEGTYDFLIWADYVDTGTQTDKHYNSDSEDGLMAVSIINANYQASDDSRDCFAAVRRNIEVKGTFNMGAISLIRPMAKMVIKDSDISTPTAGKSLSIDFLTTIPSGYDVLNATVWTTEVITPQFPAIVENEVLGFDYLFVSDATATYNINVIVGSIPRSVPSVEFKRNITTNITANFN